MTDPGWNRVPSEPHRVNAPPAAFAIALSVSIAPGGEAATQVIEQMLTNMFVGDPPGTCDRILDVSTAAPGTTFFVPSNEMLSSLDDG